MSSQAAQSDVEMNDDRRRGGDDEAEEERERGGNRRRNRERVRIHRDQEDVPPVIDRTGEHVTSLFEEFLEKLVHSGVCRPRTNGEEQVRIGRRRATDEQRLAWV